MIPPAVQRLLDKNRQHRVLERIAAALDAWRRGAKATALELLDEARVLVLEDISREEEYAPGTRPSVQGREPTATVYDRSTAVSPSPKEGDTLRWWWFGSAGWRECPYSEEERRSIIHDCAEKPHRLSARPPTEAPEARG